MQDKVALCRTRVVVLFECDAGCKTKLLCVEHVSLYCSDVMDTRQSCFV